jgi:predicted metal-dependent hydrolase
MAETEILSFVEKKRTWIIKHLNNESSAGKISVKGIRHGDTLVFNSYSRTVNFAFSSAKGVAVTNDQINVFSPEPDNETLMNRLFIKWFMSEAGKLITERAEAIILAGNMEGLKPKVLKIRIMKSRWGSCSRNGTVTVNAMLALTAVKYIDYVILHELCHLRHHNHGKGFYGLLETVCPDYKTLRKELHGYRL